MCIFSQDVDAVYGTKIFARKSEGNGQFLVYSMGYEANQELAMILPLPTPEMPGEDAIRFIDLSEYSGFFEEMDSIFPVPRGISASYRSKTLKVHSVGNFEASFVPHRNEFARLDRRFCLSDVIWNKLSQYHDFSFAVFKLKAGHQEIHPMAFEFPRRNADELYFPTIHVHNGTVEQTAHFNHVLYCQSEIKQTTWDVSMYWNDKTVPAKEFMQIEKTQGIVNPEQSIQKQHIAGDFKNQDIYISDRQQ